MIAISDVDKMDRAELLSAWTEVHGRPAPKGLSQSLLRRFLAFELQAQQRGGLCRKSAAMLRQGRAPRPKASRLRSGGRLVREWNGKTHVVDVEAEGYLYNGKSWRSLSAIARHITGAHWSGPRFFGLSESAQ